MTEPALVVRGLEAGYGKIQVLWGVDLEVAAGSFLAVIGANGAGKTTLLRALTGLIPVRRGEVHALGRPLRGLSAAQIVRGRVGHVPEGRQLFPLMTVRENLDAGADYLPAARPRAERNRALVYELFPRLREREGQIAGTLSGGERQMVAIGRALMSDPKLLLVDEPSLGLSPALASDVFTALGQIASEGVTVVLVEQNVQRSLQLADQAVVLEHGAVRQRGTGAELLADPAVRAAYLSL
ncbi:MAG: ABC transporter ATP-binding protein [Trueperaceae bacterium]|nr:ABC transporter ATP-binding protein [Trueperaceae bacterium]